MLEKSLVSIIVPVYKVEKYLSRCIESIINQTYKNIEIILVDDGSPDKCPIICDDFAKQDQRIRVIHKINGGVSDARNVGIKESSGKYICFVDGDDYLSSFFCEKTIKEAEMNNCDIVITDFYTFRDNKAIETHSLVSDRIINKDMSAYFCGDVNTHRAIWATLFKSSIIKNIQFEKDLKIAEDFLFLLRSLKVANNITYLKECLYYYYINNDSIMNSKIKDNNFFINSINGLKKCKDEIQDNKIEKMLNFEIYMNSCLSLIYVNKQLYKKYSCLNDRDNYKTYINNVINKRSRRIAFLFRYKMFFLYKMLLKTKQIFKKKK